MCEYFRESDFRRYGAAMCVGVCGKERSQCVGRCELNLCESGAM